MLRDRKLNIAPAIKKQVGNYKDAQNESVISFNVTYRNFLRFFSRLNSLAGF